MKKRGQAAMEFLMTYGWAILAAIIVIAVLAIYFRPSNLVGQVSVISPPFTALSQSISQSTNLTVEIKNNGAETLTLSALPVLTINSPTGVTCSGDYVLSPDLTIDINDIDTDNGDDTDLPYQWNPGVPLYLICTEFDSLILEGRSFDADISFTYTSGSGTLPKISKGSISGKIDA